MADVKHSKKYNQIKTRYDKGYVTLAQLHRYVELGAITAEEYEEICGEPYVEE